MEKVQKTLQFHDEVAKLVQAYADKKGTTFQRVVQAAVLQFFFGSTEGPDQAWLSAFVELEKGEGDPPLDLANLPIKVWSDFADELQIKLDTYLERSPKKKNSDWAKACEGWITNARTTAGVWRTGIEIRGGGLDALIRRAISDIEEQSRFQRGLVCNLPDDDD